jgi:hypothetical protein
MTVALGTALFWTYLGTPETAMFAVCTYQTAKTFLLLGPEEEKSRKGLMASCRLNRSNVDGSVDRDNFHQTKRDASQSNWNASLRACTRIARGLVRDQAVFQRLGHLARYTALVHAV